ncbi:DMSO/selenate family reductase complex B subunit [uncultured Ferrimonas sp.]|uniref:DMSO/selenate family reductase complex B subunit n=1 Tax=uncultured Ferrimonas sp. TaxID=432640 RepID=UPI002613F961|nr:DMSO/selenate family reductase complex B subunit [uncultured Ferrimonas sp.]
MTDQTQYGFFIDTTKCTGCKACHVSCKDDNELPLGVKWRRVYEYAGGQWQTNADGSFENSVFTHYISMGCNHCSHPVCVKACPTGACHKRKQDGLVHIDASVCVGCRSCERACPYDAPQFDDKRGVMTKCDGCFDRIKAGLKPVCVESCTMRALDFGPIDELRATYGSNADIEPLAPSSTTNPNMVIKVNRLNQSGGAIINTFEV